ncbi:MAG: T9SS type A sorting domain-containing protein [Cytophagia bacterium]|nr:T9SS type A sorting domain-containing protein [Cytophagia bacterium]
MKKGILTILLAALLAVVYSQNVVTYIGTPETSGATTTAVNRLSAKLNQPYDMAFDSKGNMWISEMGNHTITMVRAYDNKVMIRAGMAGTAGFMNGNGTQAKFNSPHGITVGPNDEIYVADYENHVIRKISAYVDESTPQVVSVFAGKYTVNTPNYKSYSGYAEGNSGTAQFNNPIDLEVDAAGNIYVSDHSNHVIRKINASGTVSLFAGQAGVTGKANGDATTVAQFSSPTGLFQYNSLLYVLDYGNKQTRRIDGSTVSKEPTILTANYPMELVYKIEGSTKTFYFTEGNMIKHAYSSPTGSGSSLYAGSLFQSGSADGTLTNARFKTTKGLTFGPNGSMYIADMDNHTIRKITYCPVINPVLTVIGELKFCGDDSVKFIAPDGYATYLWSSGESTKEIVVKNTEIINLTVSDNDGCMGTSSSYGVTKLRPDLRIVGDTIFCEGGSVLLGSQNSYDTYLWSNGELTHDIVVSTSGIYHVEMTYKSCNHQSRDVQVVVNQLPEKPTITVNGNVLTASDAPSYQWYRNNQIIPSSTSKTMTVSKSGNFKVVISSDKGCQKTSDVVYVIGSSINDYSQMTLSVYPNPTYSSITIEGLGNLKAEEINLYDLKGKLVYHEIINANKVIVDMRSLNMPIGFYILKVRTNKSFLCSKVLYK